MELVSKPSEVGPGYGPVVLGSRRVPNLDLDHLVVQLDLLRPELHSDRRVDYGVELLFEELAHQTGLAHVRVPEQDELEEEVIVRHCS